MSEEVAKEITKRIVAPRIRGFICLNAHPGGCAQEVEQQIETARREKAEQSGGSMLVIGSSTGYGLASRISGAFGHGMNSLGLFYEREADAQRNRTASAGWYNSAFFSKAARAEGLIADNINGDAFSAEILEQTLDHIRERLGPLDRFIYSIAAPVRTDPETGVTHRSVLKPIGQQLSIKTIDPETTIVGLTDFEPATEEEIADTVAVMGGADLRRWVDALLKADLLKEGARVVAYSYIGPNVTWPIYTAGSIGRAKSDLAEACADLDSRLQEEIGGRCYVSVMKSVVTQASTAIPAVPLYLAIVYRVMKEKGLHERPIEQVVRLFEKHIGHGVEPTVDEHGFIRLDDLEMLPEVQNEIDKRWEVVSNETLADVADWDDFRKTFRNLFGFEVDGVDYDQPVEIDVSQ